jgi:hypothetical protein
MKISTTTTAELVAEYNRLSGKSIKKFSSRAAGEKQVAALIAKQPIAQKIADKVAKLPSKVAPAAPKAPADRSAAIRQSWAVMATHNARSQRDSVEVDGVSYRSTKAAFDALSLPLAGHIRFRMALKASGKRVMEHADESGKVTKYVFKLLGKAKGEAA